MSVAAALERARTLGVRVSRDGGDLCLRGPRLAVEQVAPLLRQHKECLLEALTGPDPNEHACHWLVFRTDGTPPTEMFVSLVPGVSRRELRARFPGAALIPLPDTARDWKRVDETGLEDAT